jgi:CBS-domain-containing membrane protein
MVARPGHGQRRVAPSTVADVMERRVVTISPSASVRELVDLLCRHGISGVPVVDERDGVVGTVSVTDLMWRSQLFAADGAESPKEDVATRGLDEGTVRDVMTPDVFGVAPDATLAELVRFFASTGLGRAVVLDGRRLVGIVSAADLLHLIADQPRAKTL